MKRKPFSGPLSSARPSPPSTSYWVGADRRALHAAIAQRRAQHRGPSDRELLYDPMVAATLALKHDHAREKR